MPPTPRRPTQQEETRPHEEGAGGAMLLVAGDGTFTMVPVTGDEITIGRDAACDVTIDHATLSRRHAILRRGPPATVEDLGSKNGTRVARRLLPAGERAPLEAGESFHIGRLSFVLVPSPHAASLPGSHSAREALRVLHPTLERATKVVTDIARSPVSVLILGETGTGKEVLAETLHTLSGRKGAFVRINCAAVAPALFESELFGHERGAFTDAAHARVGLLEAAHHGTVLLDEVGELPAAAQAKLLRAIEAREVVRVGASRPVNIDVRFIAATHRPIAAEVASGRFRADLYFRLDGVTLMIPPLRERRAQIAPLALEFLSQARAQQGAAAAPRITPDVLTRLEQHDWPGNVRELKAVIERALLLSGGGDVRAAHLAITAAAPPPAPPPGPTPAPPEGATTSAAHALSPDEQRDRDRIVEALEACAGNQTRAAKLLGVSRATLSSRLALYRIPRPRK